MTNVKIYLKTLDVMRKQMSFTVR